ncbi:hypothetical protein HPULCUR_005245 [Helicostylum pulchrum]|uniref:Uncharacterized protein n=1 Tax=Helicostylum pulchrum TaxID=562976 RepID=A0ABP9XYM8_9FUNG
MQRSISLKKFCCKPNTPLCINDSTKLVSTKPTRQVSTSSVSLSKVVRKSASPSEDEIRRYVVGLSTMKNGTLNRTTSSDQVIKFFSPKKSDTIRTVLERKTKVLQSKSGHPFLEWIY